MSEVCPVCRGTMNVPAGFYNTCMTESFAGNGGFEKCRSCVNGVVGLTALERGAEDSPVRCPKCLKEIPFCKCPPKPAPVTVERYNAFKFTHSTSCEAENHCWRDPIGEVVATRHGSTPTQCIEIVHNGKSEIFSPKQYEWIVEHLTSAGVWERKNDE